ncbi:RGS1-HXK1-interacting protein 1-like [Musa acuminata AAA Group]|uniref:RGS1-HXK1-interacting protein 1-like n=1 Tax=Musa acuminata AAA Group TaxID=214697 RepID=UPI0031D1AFD4
MDSRSDSTGPAVGSAQSSQHRSPRPLEKFQDLMLRVRSHWQAYEDALVHNAKDELLVAYDHPLEACGVVVVAGILLLRGPRRFLYRKTLGRFKTEEERLTDAESFLREINESVTKLKKESKNLLTKVSYGEEDLHRGRTKIRAAGHEIQRLNKSIYKIESEAADLMEELRTIPGRTALELRAEVAPMTSSLKNQRLELNERVTKISELGIRV